MKNNTSKMRCKQGFTLIELLVVVLIIGILAAVAVPQYNKAVEKARAAEAVLIMSMLEKAVDRWLLENDPSPTSFVTFLGDRTSGHYTYADLDIDLPCQEEDESQCFNNGYFYGAECTGYCYVAVYPQGNHYYPLVARKNLSGNTWSHKCGYHDSISKAICDGLAAQGWESEEGWDF